MDTTATPVTTELYTAAQYAALEAELVRAKSNRDLYQSSLATRIKHADEVKDYLIENYDDLGHHADEIATLLDIELEREVTYSVSMSCSVTVTVKCGEDGEDLITENLYIDSNDGNISIDDYNVDTVYEA
jgi:porphobilinogen deaminase